MEGRILVFIATYTAGIFYASYLGIKRPYDISKIKWS